MIDEVYRIEDIVIINLCISRENDNLLLNNYVICEISKNSNSFIDVFSKVRYDGISKKNNDVSKMYAGQVKSIYKYCDNEELTSGFISEDRLLDIYYLVNKIVKSNKVVNLEENKKYVKNKKRYCK